MEATLQQSVLRSTTASAVRKGQSILAMDWLTCIAGLGDFLAVLGGSTLALFCRKYITFGLSTNAFYPSDYMNLVLFGTLVYMFLLQFNEAYARHRFVHRFHFLKFTLKTTAHWLLGFLVISFVFKMESNISRLYIAWSVVDSMLLLIAWRMIFRQFLYTGGWASALKDRVLVVGWSKESDALAQQIARDPEHHPYEIVGCVPSSRGEYAVAPHADVAQLGEFKGIRRTLHEHRPGILIFADPEPQSGELVALTELCIKENVQFKLIPSFFQIFASGLHLESVSGVPVVGVSKLPLDHLHNRLLKQAVDIVGALVGLIAAAPLIAYFGYQVYKESPGPIFYSQVRAGRGGRPFKIWKIRSMKINAEAVGGVQWTKENDPRRLKVGEFMRKYNIDEVPQFWNVLKGDMSLVGPRPERPELIENFKEEITHYNARHFGLPGLSGYAQVNGLRGDTCLRERVRYDLFYLENWSLWLDIQIMIKTFFNRTGAY
jgi:exopolysaccharide biosynthesis polyprenyl glycosylphosphotransferase